MMEMTRATAAPNKIRRTSGAWSRESIQRDRDRFDLKHNEQTEPEWARLGLGVVDNRWDNPDHEPAIENSSAF